MNRVSVSTEAGSTSSINYTRACPSVERKTDFFVLGLNEKQFLVICNGFSGRRVIVFLQLRVSGMEQSLSLKSKVIKNDRFYFLFQQDNEDTIKNHEY